MKKIAIFASGGGSNFKAIHNEILAGNINGTIDLFITNNPKCQAKKFAIESEIKTLVVNNHRYPYDSNKEKVILEYLNSFEIDLICLAGYMKIIPKKIVKSYKNRILNIHPGLLPKFGGKGFFGSKVHEAVLNSKEAFSGATVHFVDEIYDHGPIVSQCKLAINNDETPKSLAQRILKVEHELFPKVIKAFCEDRIKITSNQIKIMD
jgi:formyltetrahydrofolate-dependent phosphoribosylglycinamide formyltransferase